LHQPLGGSAQARLPPELLGQRDVGFCMEKHSNNRLTKTVRKHQMKVRTFNPFPFQLALSLLLAFARTETEEFPAENVKASLGDTLTDVEIKTMLRDYIDTDKLGVGLVVGIV